MNQPNSKFASVAIRRAEPEDAEDLVNLKLAAGVGAIGLYEVTDWNSVFAEPDVYTYLAEDEEPFGVVTVGSPRDALYRDGKTGEVIAWQIHQRFRDSDYGRKLLVHGLSVIKRRNYSRALIRIPEFAEEAIQSVRSLQFEQTDVKPMGDVNLLVFTLTLEEYF